MNKKPNVFVNKIDKNIENNERVFYGKANEKKEEVSNEIKTEKVRGNNIEQKIANIFASPNYVYKVNVKITFKDKEVIKKIVGKNRNYLITMDNELIPIVDIIDIELIQK